MEALPVTRVGKIFKPELLRREIETVVRAEAAAAGAEIGSLNVDQDPSLGLVARVRVASGGEPLRQCLERYAFKFEITQSPRSCNP